MLLVPFAGRDNKPLVKLPNGVIGIIADKDHDSIQIDPGNEYEFMITGFSKRTTAHGLPTTVFVRLARENDYIVHAPILVCSGSMCTTSSHGEINGKSITIYPGRNYPGFIAEENSADFYRLPRYPAYAHNMWVNSRDGNKFYAVGVNSYHELAPSVAALPEFEEIKAIRNKHSEDMRAGWQSRNSEKGEA